MKKKTLESVGRDFPLIYFSTVGAAVTQYIISLEGKQISFVYIFGIMLITLVALGLIYLVYRGIYLVERLSIFKK